MRRGLSRVALVLALLLNAPAARGASQAPEGQAARGGVTKREEEEARAVAAAFTDRLADTHDFTPLVAELYAADFMTRYLRNELGAAPHPASASFWLDGVPGIFFRESLAAHPESAYWPRLYAAAQTFQHFGLLSLYSRRSLKEMIDDPRGADPTAMLEVYPPEAVKLLDGNPTLANYLKMKGRPVDVETLGDLRAVTETLEGAVRLTRARLGERLPKGKHLAENLRMMKAAAARTEVEPLPMDGALMGYPEGARFFKVFTPIGYRLVLVKEGGPMKVLWASVPSE